MLLVYKRAKRYPLLYESGEQRHLKAKPTVFFFLMEHKVPRVGSKNNSSVKIFHQQSKINLPEFLVKNSKHSERLKLQTMGTKTGKRNLKDHLLNT